MVSQLLEHGVVATRTFLQRQRDATVERSQAHVERFGVDDVARERVTERVTFAIGRDDELQARGALESRAHACRWMRSGRRDDVEVEVATHDGRAHEDGAVGARQTAEAAQNGGADLVTDGHATTIARGRSL